MKPSLSSFFYRVKTIRFVFKKKEVKFKAGKILFRGLKYTGITLSTILVLMFSIPYLFPGFVSDKIKNWANHAIESKLNFSKARLSFFNHFPSLTLTLYDVSLTGSAPFEKDTLVSAKEIALGVDLSTVFNKAIRINEIYITRGNVQVLVSKEGQPNYNIYKRETKTTSGTDTDTAASDAALKLDRIQIEESALLYNDLSIPILIKANRFNYLGKGNLSEAVFNLKSEIRMEGVDFVYDGEQYLTDKKLNAKLRTRINTHSLELDFRRNDLMINKLPVALTGTFLFLKNGYRMDFNAKTPSTEFENLFTALPPAFVTWLDKTDVGGKIEMGASLKGDFIAGENRMPDLNFNMKVSKGSFATTAVKEKITDLYLNFHFVLPELNTEKMIIGADTLNARLGKDYVKASFETKGLSKPSIKGSVQVAADVEKWAKILDLPKTAGIDVKGFLQLQANFIGIHNPAQNQYPLMNAAVQWKKGVLQTNYYPQPITDIDVDLNIINSKGTAEAMQVKIKPLSLQFEGQPFTLTADVKNFDNLVYTISSKGSLNIGKLYKLFAIEGYDINGFIKTDLSLSGTQADAVAGRYDQLNNKGSIEIRQVNLRTPCFPNSFLISSGLFHINNDQLKADQFVMHYLSNTVSLKGTFGNIINYIMKKDAPLQGDLSLTGKQILIQEFMSTTDSTAANTSAKKANTTPAETATGVIIIPANLDFQFHAAVDKVDYNGLTIHNWIADAGIKNGNLKISKSAFTIVGAPVNMEATYAPVNNMQALFSYHINAKEFDIQKAYKEIQLFREMLTSAAKVKGQVSIDYTLNGMLNDSLYPVTKSLKGGGTVSIKNANISGYKLFSAISKKTGKDAVDNPDLSKQTIELKTTIANNIINLQKVKLRVAGFRPRFEGQIGFDGRLNLKVRLGLPPFGILGIPLTVTGTQEKPLVRLGRGKKEGGLDEEGADEEDKKEASEATDKNKQQN